MVVYAVYGWACAGFYGVIPGTLADTILSHCPEKKPYHRRNVRVTLILTIPMK